ncbi:MAG: S16 family serine protease [Acidimicrobiia bacterium]
MHRPRALSALGTVAIALLLGSSTVACSGSGSSAGRTITVPVLWAGASAGGVEQSGIEPAKITVGDGGAQFALNLDDLEAKKTGAQWNAATASAAAVATLASALDPAKVDVSYRVTGPIDGPSGGAMLTVGTLAGLRSDTLRRATTMTGTISPDGSVGRVGGIPAKLRAASKAGYTKVLLPTANLRASGEPSTTDMVAYGTSLGLEVRGVDTVAEAYEAFTGVQLIPPGTSAPGLSPPVQAAADATTRGLVERLRTQLAATPSTLSGERSIAQRGLASAEAALAAGDLARAYGVAVDACTVLARAEGAAKVDSVIAASGIEGARQALRTDVAALRARAAEVLRSGSQLSGVDAVAQILTPAALGWTTYSDALLAGIDSGLADGSITAVGMTVTGAAIAEQRVSIEVFQADALTMVRSAPNAQVTTVRPPAEFLSGYTDFLIRAGKANAEYYTAVVSRGGSAATDASGQPAFTVLALGALTAAAESIPSGIQTIDDEIRQSALAFTFFVIGTGLVANTSLTGISGSAIGSDAVSTIDIPGLVRSVEEASTLVDVYAAAFVARSIDTGSPLWSSRWGVGAALALNGTGRDATGEVIAQNELWYDVVAMSSLWAATTP